MKSADDTQKIIVSAQQGEAVAWNFLFRKHYPWMYATALQICGNSPSAKDAVQETLVNAYLKIQQLKDTNAFAGWLKTSLVRYCRRIRQEHALPTQTDCCLIESAYLWDDELNRKHDWYEQQTKLYNTLACLPDILQSVLLLRYFSSFNSYEQIAAILCIPVGTVRSRLNQVKQKMMEHWVECDDNDKAFRQVNEWNDLYTVYFDNIYTSLHYREKLIEHCDKNLQLVFTSGKTVFGRKMMEQQIEDDILYGNSFGSLQVMSSGNISIIEVNNINPAEYPDRCPDSTVFVLHRTGNKTTRLHLHNSR